MSLLKLKDRVNFLKTYLTPALEEGLISMKYPKIQSIRDRNICLQKKARLY